MAAAGRGRPASALGCFDTVVIGAGSAGAVVAAEASEDPRRRVLLLEAGDDFRSAETPAVLRRADPARAIADHRHRWPRLVARFTDRQPPRAYACGRGAGGSSSINGQVALRPPPGDVEDWNLPGWSWAEMLAALIDVEHDADFGAAVYHGRHGALPVSRLPPPRWGPLSGAVFEAAMALGYGEAPDVNAPDAAGAAPLAWNRSAEGRVSTNDAFLEPARGRPNLVVLGNSPVRRLLFDGVALRGVEFQRPGSIEVADTGQVVLCAGAVYSPAILLRSGVGPAGDLATLGIAPVAEVAGVGHNLSDHPCTTVQAALRDCGRARARADGPTGCAIVRGGPGSGGPGSGHPGGGHPGDLAFLPVEHGFDPRRAGLTVSLLAPRSVGSVRLRSADPLVDPLVQIEALSHPDDLESLQQGLRAAASLVGHPACRRVVEGPVMLGGTPLEAQSPADVGEWLLANVTTMFHATGTCRMGSGRDDSAVVDETGAVRALGGVHVADGSILPLPVRAPTQLAIVAVALLVSRRLWSLDARRNVAGN